MTEPHAAPGGPESTPASSSGGLGAVNEELRPVLANIRRQIEANRAAAQVTLVAEEGAHHTVVEPPALAPLTDDYPAVRAVMEHNLGRKAVFSSQPDREQMVFKRETEDLIGKLTVEYTLGQLGKFEMQLTMWILGRWNPRSEAITFNLRECARDFRMEWGGFFARQVKDALRRIDRTRFTGEVYHKGAKTRVTRMFGIFSDVQIHERQVGTDGVAREPGTVSLKLAPFFVEQLEARQYATIDWQTVRFALSTGIAQRLYVFLEGQKGWEYRDPKTGETHTEYLVDVDHRLVATLGSTDANMRRMRAKLTSAGKEIMAADARYFEIALVAAKRGRAYQLRVRRYGAPAKALKVLDA